MASEDVIELGSSDEETEPVSKKMKPVPNAMVHIPRGVTIKPAKPNLLSIPKQLSVLGKSVTITNISKGNSGNSLVHNPYAVKKKTYHQNVPQTNLNVIKPVNAQVAINKLPKPLKVPAVTKILNKPIKISPSRTINSLPPSITVTRTTGNLKRPSNVNIPIVKKRKVVKPTFTEVPTVELDDDEATPSSNASPQWYVRPEDQLPSLMEVVNNKEPEKPQFVEITIEDSPVKPPPQNKRACEVSADDAVTIEDSPVKVLTKNNTASTSDTENTDKPEPKEKHSKKKLEYPKEPEADTKTIEIEVPPIGEGVMNVDIVSNKSKIDIIEIEESPLKLESEGIGTPKKNNQSTLSLESAKSIEGLQDNDSDLTEFHPVYRDFIKLCFWLENSDDMKKIVEKKVKTYYRQVPKDYTESDEFIDMVSSKIVAMKAGPQKMYLYIKDIVDELNLQRKLAKSQTLNNISLKKAESNDFLYGEDSEYDSKRQRQIRKLEKTLKKLHRAIQKLETQEVDFDDDEDSVYLLTESDEGSSSNKDSDNQLGKDPKTLLQRYKERMVRVHAKFCQLTNTKMPSEPRLQIDARPGHPSGPAKRLEKWINKKVPIGTPLPFPDFHDVLRCVKEANNEDKLGWNDVDIMEEARDLFTRCGKKLQRRRQENEWRLAASRITTAENDPAENNIELNKKLEDNKKLASKKETELFNKFADRQSQLKLEAEEIGDKEAEESPVESDEEETNEDELSLKNKEKRKERLKRLLQEKSQKSEENNTKTNINGSQDDIEMIVPDITENIDASRSPETKSNNESKNETLDNEKINTADKEQIKEPSEKVDNITPTVDGKATIVRDIDKNKEKSKSAEVESNINVKDKEINDENGKVQTLDGDALESDVDELHLLQKLHSGSGGNTSTIESSDSETPIAISDTLGSSSENNKQASDVISIENSSYSESEINREHTDVKDNKIGNDADKVDSEMLCDTEIECTGSGIQKKIYLTSNNEYDEPVEDILLASSDDETVNDNNSRHANLNREGDNLSTGDTVLGGNDKASNATESDCADKQEDSNSVESVGILSTKSDPLDKIIIDEVKGNIKESDYADKQEDTSSLESVTYISNDDVSSDDKIVDKSDENANKAKSSELCNVNDIVLKNNETDIAGN